MRRLRWFVLLFVIAATGSRFGVAIGQVAGDSTEARWPYEGSATEAVTRQAGWRLERLVVGDVTQDGVADIVAVEREVGAPSRSSEPDEPYRGQAAETARRGGLRLVVRTYAGGDAKADPNAFRIAYADRVPRAADVVRLSLMSIGGDPAADVLAMFESRSPDERAVTIRILGRVGGTLRTMLDRTVLNDLTESAATLAYGEGAPHFLVKDVDGDGRADVQWTLGPVLLPIKGPDGPLEASVGARVKVLRFDPNEGRFIDSGVVSSVDFLPPRPPSAVEASAQVPKIWGTSQAFWGADGDLDTAWTVRRAAAIGQSLTIRFKDRPSVAMIRVVPGCGGNKADWARYHRLSRFRIHLSNGVRFEMSGSPTERTAWPAQVAGLGVYPLDGDFGRQILIFLKDRAPIDWGRIEVVEVARARAPRKRRVDEVCLSEISFH